METLYLKGFNEGYLVALHHPALAEKLSGIRSQLPRIEGFKDGHRQFLLEKLRDLQPHWMQEKDYGLPPPSREIDRDIAPDR
ncbi:hypothetical protein [Flavobacterium sp. 3HN19-14]|uniref:hypothetical protein n=1 Tax=Flavobacterium sp. 3HN19-14 TaxID=3448133 RepID=UPI003EDFF27B